MTCSMWDSLKVGVVGYDVDLLSTVACDAVTYCACLSHLAWKNHQPAWTMRLEHLSPQMWVDSPHKRAIVIGKITVHAISTSFMV